MGCLPQLGSVPAAYAVVAGGCDWPLPSAVDLSNNDVIALRAFRQLCYVSYVPYVSFVIIRSLRSLLCARWVEWKLRFRIVLDYRTHCNGLGRLKLRPHYKHAYNAVGPWHKVYITQIGGYV